MCTRPDRDSVLSSARAAGDASMATLTALATLVLALLGAPIRFARRRREACARPASVQHIDVQVLLEDQRCVSELRRMLHRTLERSAHTWAPLLLPIDRIVVSAAFPARGKSDVYRDFPRTVDNRGERPGAKERPFVVVCLGLRDGERELEPAEIAAALATQIEAVVADRFARRSVAFAAAAEVADMQVIARPSATNTVERSSTRKNGTSAVAPQPHGSADDEAEGMAIAFSASPLDHPNKGTAA
jgi:hypothetical protein